MKKIIIKEILLAILLVVLVALCVWQWINVKATIDNINSESMTELVKDDVLGNYESLITSAYIFAVCITVGCLFIAFTMVRIIANNYDTFVQYFKMKKDG